MGWRSSSLFPIGDGAAMITLVLGSAAEQCTTCTEFDKHKHIKRG